MSSTPVILTMLLIVSISSMSSVSPFGVGLVAAALEELGEDGMSSSAENVLALSFTMIPDQDQQVEQARGEAISTYLSSMMLTSWGPACSYEDITVSFVPATDYQDAVDAILDGRVDFGWYGGLTGVEVLQRGGVDNFDFWVQRLEDQSFTTTFIYYDNEGDLSSTTVNYESLSDVENKSFAFGSELSTSGHLMPQYFLDQENVELDPSKTIYTGSHDATIDGVGNGTVQVGAVNTLTWERRLASNDTGSAEEFFVTDEYADYMWLGRRTCGSHNIVASTSTLSSVVEYDSTGCDNDVITSCSDYFLNEIRSALLDVAERSRAGSSSSSGNNNAIAQSAQSILDTFSTVGFVSVDLTSYEPIYTTACSLELLNCTTSEDENRENESTPSGGSLNDGSDNNNDDNSSSGPRNCAHLWPSKVSIVICMAFAVVVCVYHL